MAITVSGTSITFNDGTTQTTAGGAPTTAQVLSATAGASVGAVGTYVFGTGGTANYNPGATISGASLKYAGIWAYSGSGFLYSNSSSGQGSMRMTSSMAGTWRCMGYSPGFSDYGTSIVAATLWLRIS